MSYIDRSESPWMFEEKGTQRIMDTDKIFLWHHSDNLKDRENDIVCYRLIDDGLGLSWGYWLWENKKWFKQNGIKGVKFHRLGVLSKRTVELRCNYFYTECSSRFVKIIKPLWTLITRVRHFKGLVLTIGFRRAINKKIG